MLQLSFELSVNKSNEFEYLVKKPKVNTNMYSSGAPMREDTLQCRRNVLISVKMTCQMKMS